jgi:hypothetical protein
MSNKYIKLSFKNAKLFPKNVKTKDFTRILSLNSKDNLYFSRCSRGLLEMASFKESITVHQISNMLHTLIGERPVPSFRKTFYNRNETIFELANKSYLKIDSPKTTKTRKDEVFETYIDEFTKTNKSASDSWTKPSSIQWFKIKKYMGVNYDEFIEIINSSLGYDVTKKPFETLLNSYSKEGVKLDIVINFLLDKKKTPIVNFLTKEIADRSEITKNGLLGETIISGIDNVYNISGEILVPYEQGFVDKLRKNTTNILDGGFVKIEGVFYEYELNDTDEFILVSEISDEKY